MKNSSEPLRKNSTRLDVKFRALHLLIHLREVGHDFAAPIPTFPRAGTASCDIKGIVAGGFAAKPRTAYSRPSFSLSFCLFLSHSLALSSSLPSTIVPSLIFLTSIIFHYFSLPFFLTIIFFVIPVFLFILILSFCHFYALSLKLSHIYPISLSVSRTY